MKDLQQLVERQLMTRRNSDFLWAALGFFVLCVVISGIWDLYAVGMTVGLTMAIALRFLLRHKLKILSEPMVFSEHAVLAVFRGATCVFVRGSLGRGRQMSLKEVTAWRLDVHGHRVPVVVTWHPRRVVGPWSLVLEDGAREGALYVCVVATEGTKPIEHTGTWDLSLVQEGQFVPVCDWKSGRLWGNVNDWDKLKSCGPSSSPAP